MASKERDEIIALEAVEEYLNGIDWINDEIRTTLNYVIEAMIGVPKKHESKMFKIVMALSRNQEVEAASLFGLIADAITASENAIQKKKCRIMHWIMVVLKDRQMTYICGLTKDEYDELLNRFVTQFVGWVVDEDKLSYKARAGLTNLMVTVIEEDDNAIVEAYCTKPDIQVSNIINLLEGIRTV